ncbi:Gfo/Idh/MocA family protein [Maribacter halichondriae]|uniref:Gfo/Idh/MocA family protein n=1 Tax=Maribacter halichondriae TaxID=2980554 RepID=UPI0023598492|nr:Gfo/Idh/MocA family oxidoreductase [Maribacter sp. Hal144]
MSKKKTELKNESRRTFVKNSGLAAAGFMIVPRHVLGGQGYVPPSDTLNIAGIGAGGKGRSDMASFAESPNAKIVAMCDVDDRQAVESRKNFPKASYYQDFRKMLEKEKDNIDAVSVSTPDHNHAVAAYQAMAMGKHVYVQKPLTHDIWEARMLTEAAKKFKVVTQMGNQGGSGDGVRKMKEIYDTGIIGDVHTVKCWTNRAIWPQALETPTKKDKMPKGLNWDLWLGTAEMRDYNDAYLPFDWRGWSDFGTGALGDMACHIMDPVYRILPILYPSTVECSVSDSFSGNFQYTEYPKSFPNSSKIHLSYPRTDGKGTIKVSWMDGGLLPERPDELGDDEALGNWDGGVLFIGTKGKLLADCYGANPRLLPLTLNEQFEVEETIKRVPEGHYLQWVNACMAGYGNAETSSSFDYAGPFTESILIGNLALKAYFEVDPASENKGFWGGGSQYYGRKRLNWDAENMKITNFEPANKYVKRSYREGYSLG